MRTFVTVFCCLLLMGCLGNDRPDKILAEEQYINLIIELQLLRSHQKQLPEETNIDSMKAAIFNKYETTEAIFQESHSYYQQNVDQQSDRIKEAIDRLRQDRVKPQDSTAAQ